MSGNGFKLTDEQRRALQANATLGSWADEMNRENVRKAANESARRAALTPAQRAAENAAKVAAEAARAAVAAHPAVRAARFAAPMARAALAPRLAAPAAWRPPAGKTMRECRNSNVGHAHASGAACKYVHKNENAYGHLRPEQKRPDGGKSSRKGSRRSSRKTRRKASRKANRKSRRSGGGDIKIVPSPAPLSKVDTYTSWPGGIDPTVPLYNQRTMLGGKRSGAKRSGAKRSTRRNSSRRNSSRRNNRR